MFLFLPLLLTCVLLLIASVGLCLSRPQFFPPPVRLHISPSAFNDHILSTTFKTDIHFLVLSKAAGGFTFYSSLPLFLCFFFVRRPLKLQGCVLLMCSPRLLFSPPVPRLYTHIGHYIPFSSVPLPCLSPRLQSVVRSVSVSRFPPSPPLAEVALIDQLLNKLAPSV